MQSIRTPLNINKMLFLLLLNIMLRAATEVIGIPLNGTLPNKTLILRSAVDSLNDDLEDAKNLEDVMHHNDLPTSEPPDFLESFEFRELNATSGTILPNSELNATNKIPVPTPMIPIPSNLYDKAETIELPTVAFEMDMTYSFTTPKLPTVTRRIFTRSTYYDPVTLDYDSYWKKYSENKMWNPINNLPFRPTTEFVNPEHTRTYISTTNRPLTSVRTTYVYYPSKLYLITERDRPPDYKG